MRHKTDIDLVLVNPGQRAQSYQSLASTLAAIDKVKRRIEGIRLCPTLEKKFRLAGVFL